MKNKFYTMPIKATAVVLAVLVVLFTVLSGVAGGMMLWKDFYTRPLAALQKDTQRQLLDECNYQAYEFVFWSEDPELAEEISERYYFQITDEEGNLLAGNYNGQQVILTEKSVFMQEIYIPAEDGENVYEEHQLTVTGYLGNAALGTDRFALADRWIAFFYQLRYWVFVFAFFGLLTEVGLLVYLFCSAGNHPGEESPRLNPLDKLPFDVVTVVLVAAATLELCCLDVLGGWEVVVFLLFFGVLDFLLLLWYFMSLATRLKVGTFFHTTLFGRLFALLGRGFKALGGWLRQLFSNLPLVWKTSLIVGVISLLELIIMLAVWNKLVLILWWLLEKFIAVPLVILVAISLRKLQRGGEKLAEGNLDERLETDFLVGDFKKFGGTLNSIGAGMNHAVEERMKSERFKTELITNVSHDIKTPLTSIINYVDLIKKEEPENENVRQYVEVLDWQSARLKKLIEDLVEASKASTGNLTVRPESCDAGVLLTQLAGEYDERFRAKGLEPVLHLPEVPIMVMADPRHFWRILDNLMVNIVKYAQAGTRVYLDLFAGERETALVFRNVSQAPLNISGDELMERFVRGDSSRNTEGSGLGLSIARSLAELQGGSLNIAIDGDLFKVTLRFPRLQ